MSIPLCLDCVATIGAGAADCVNATITIKVTDVEDVTWDVEITRCGYALGAVRADIDAECARSYAQMLADFAADNLHDDIDAAWAARKD